MSLQTLLPVITLIAGGLLQYLGQWGTDARQRKAATEARNGDRDRMRQDRRESFELDHLLRLNEAMMRFARATGRAHFHDMMAAKQSGVYASHQLPEGVSDEDYAARRELLGLKNLVLDNNIRAKVNEAYESMSRLTTLIRATTDEADAMMLDAMNAHSQALDGIAARIRQIYLDQA